MLIRDATIYCVELKADFQCRDYQLSYSIEMNDKVCVLSSFLPLVLPFCQAHASLIRSTQEKTSYHFVVLDETDFMLWFVWLRIALLHILSTCPVLDVRLSVCVCVCDSPLQARGAFGCGLPRKEQSDAFLVGCVY